jgi:hypothetical protein
MLEPLADTFAEHATRLQRIAAIAATAFALGGRRRRLRGGHFRQQHRDEFLGRVCRRRV